MNYATAVHETVAALRSARERWAELLLAIETPPADVWPPRQLAHTLRATDDEQLLVEDRAPLVLREHPAPANLDALDTGLAIERQVFALADTLAAAVQHPRRDDPRRWQFQNPGAQTRGTRPDHGRTGCTSRAYGSRDVCSTRTPSPSSSSTAPPPHRRSLPCPRTCCTRHGVPRGSPRADRYEPSASTRAPPLYRITRARTAPTSSSCTPSSRRPRPPVPEDKHGRRVWRWADLLALVAALGSEGRPGTARHAV
ncbi:hypothetical protein [Streptomyces sp. V4I2]|uniref:hypothetical protein n=1 Tax=Streptomyces sp. V4I2 TaxID=3042280 RepID=UPI0027D7AFA7|nr:hypothetical protein [Streptomyces sp. V4I2]